MRSVISSALLCLVSVAAMAASSQQKVQIMPEDQVKAGMHGVAYTVFEGVKPEAMDVEILGVLRNMAGPKSDVILARLHGPKVEYTGVVAGMSGSPVYIDGKLVGAIAYRIGEFSKEPIAGITPAASMMEINELDKTPSAEMEAARAGAELAASRTSGPGVSPQAGQPDASYANLLKPIETPLVFSGFSEGTIRMFSQQFAAAGVVPVMGAGSVSNDKQPEPLEPGSAVSAILVRGDMDIAGTCTVTYIDATQPAGLRTSSFAVGQRRHAHDQGDGTGHLGLAGEFLQDRQHHRNRRIVCAGPPHRNHGTLRSRAPHDPGNAQLPRHHARQAVSLRGAE